MPLALAKKHPYRMIRFFSLASLVAVLVVASATLYLFRELAIGGIVLFGEQSNVTLTRTTVNALRPLLSDYLNVAGDQPTERGLFESPVFLREIGTLLQGTRVVKVKIYDRRGLVVYSTDPSQIGRHQADNRGFAKAMRGQVASKLVYRDSFNLFDKVTEEDNLIQTYLPIRENVSSPSIGVFEIYTDANDLVLQADQAQLELTAVTAIMFLLLYAVLLLIVIRAQRVIDGQRQIIAERTATLEQLTAHMLSAQEDEKKRVAERLHEGLAQTLAAADLQLEAGCRNRGANATLERASKAIQNAIQEARVLAMELRPPSLDDFGLSDTLSWFVRELGRLFPALDVELRIQVAEDEIPRPLKTIIFRIVQETANALGRAGEADKVTIGIEKQHGNIVLGIEENGLEYHPSTTTGEPGGKWQRAFASMKERAVLSGGEFSHHHGHLLGSYNLASWPAPDNATPSHSPRAAATAKPAP